MFHKKNKKKYMTFFIIIIYWNKTYDLLNKLHLFGRKSDLKVKFFIFSSKAFFPTLYIFTFTSFKTFFYSYIMSSGQWLICEFILPKTSFFLNLDNSIIKVFFLLIKLKFFFNQIKGFRLNIVYAKITFINVLTWW